MTMPARKVPNLCTFARIILQPPEREKSEVRNQKPEGWQYAVGRRQGMVDGGNAKSKI
jgi:hypothetical protein